jgi:alanine dehydrogenase
MLIGLPKETKDHENRVGMTPSTVKALTRHGHQVLVQSGAGEGSFLADAEYRSAGASIVPHAEDAWGAEWWSRSRSLSRLNIATSIET